MFTAFERPANLADAIAQQLRQKILSGEFAEGAKLPAEHELSEQFKVSRNVVRESIAQLKLNGFLNTRRGVGTFVAQNINGRKFEVTAGDLLNIEQLKHISQLRVEIEAGAAALAAQNRTPEQLKALECALIATDNAGGDWELGANAALQFHLCIAECSNNPYFIRLMEHLSFVIQNAVRTLRRSGSGTARVGDIQTEHHEIFDAIARGDAQAARIAARRHLDNGISHYFDKKAQENGA